MHALEVALRRADPGGPPPDPLAISSGFLAAIRESATDSRLLIAVDDIQWLDTSSADCLLFMARRIGAQPVDFLLSRRNDEPSPLEQALDPSGVETIEVQPLSVGAISRLLSERLGLALPRRVQHRIYEASQGNPLFALEVGRTVQEAGLPEAGSDLPVPRFVDEAFAARVRSLPEAGRRVLTAVALSAGLTQSELASVVNPLAVEDALQSGLLAADGSRVRPSHPMLAAAARTGSSAAQRRELHLALSRAVSDQVLAARHLALATVAADPVVAAVVAAAARTATERGAAHEAEELSAHAVRLTPEGSPDESDRLLELARCHLSAGDLAGAHALLEDRIARIPRGRPKALAHLMLGEASDGAAEEAELDRAIAEAGGDPELRGIALCRKSVLLTTFRVERVNEAETLAREAQSLTAGTVEESRSRMALGWALVLRGQPVEHLREISIAVRPGVQLYDTTIERPASIRRAFRGEVDAAIGMMKRLVALADEGGDPRSRIGMNIQLCEFALRKGDLTGVQPVLGDLDRWLVLDELKALRLRIEALVAAIRGRPAEARRLADGLLADSTAAAVATWDYLEADRALGLAALLDGDYPEAVQRFSAVWEHCRREGVDDPGAFPVAGDLVEALVECGRISDAAEIVDVLARLSDEQEHPWGLATAARSRAMIDLWQEDNRAAADALVSAAGRYHELGLEFEQGRCLFHLGRVLRRWKRRSGSRTALKHAIDVFGAIGSDGWARAASEELRSVSGRPATETNTLTPSEQRVVELAISGLSNKEIAKALFVSVYTVEAHLKHAYAKLGVRSRTQLVAQMLRG